MDNVVKCTEAVNRLGMDYATFSGRLDYLLDLVDKGVVTAEDCLGFQPEKGMEATCELMHLIAYRQGIGELLAGTWQECIQGIGKGRSELAVTIKGVDPSTDIRTHFCTESLGLLTSHSGGHNMRALGITIVPGRSTGSIAKFAERIGVSAERQPLILIPSGSLNYQPARLLKWVEDYNTVMLSLGACNRDPMARAFNVDILAEMYSAVTGISITSRELIQAGERIWNLEKTLNMAEGFTREDDLPPVKWAKEHRKVYGERVLPPFTEAETHLRIYYNERGWEAETGAPAPQKLLELGIAE
ncbi:MAG: aldehyde ferredoxin oxidoreductase C-terminal domain-containing protein [Desulfitobacteriaceae bacterium]